MAPGERLVVISDGNNILMKPIAVPSLAEFSALMDSAKEWTNFSVSKR